jgi:PAS domain S-box-containing protein
MFRIDHQWARFRLCLSFRSALFWITAAVLLLDSVLVMPASQLRNDVLLLHPEAPRILAGGRVDDIPFPETNSLVAMFAEPSAWDRYRSSIPGGLLLVLIETGLVALLLAERRRRKRSQRLLERRFAIEQVISESSTRLSDCPADRVDAEIESSLQALMTAEGADRSSWFVLIDSGPEARLVSSAHRPGADAEPAFYSRPELPWSTEVLLRGEPVVVPDLDLLPPEADRDRHYFAQKGVRSVALVPCSSGTGARGVLVLVCLENARAWPEALISRLAVLGNIYASATMRREAQEAKQQSEQRFRYLFEEAPFGIAIEDIDGQLLFVNPALASLLGYTTEELKGTKCGEFADNEDERDDWAHFQEMRAGLRESYQIEKRYSRKDGIRVWGRLSVSLLKGTEQRPPIVFATVEDITEKKAREQELQFVHTEVRHLTARLLQTQEEERKRIARELHDDIGQRLSLLMIDLDQLKTLLPADRTSEQAKVRDLLLQLDEVVSDVHELSHQLHSTKLQHLGLWP